MPLSEEEIRLLDQMERALVAEDPKLASAMRGTSRRRSARRRAIVAAAVFVVGIAILMTGAVLSETFIGVAGFVVMLVSAFVALSAWRGQHAAPAVREGAHAMTEADRHRSLQGIDGGKSRRRSPRSRSRGQQHSFLERFEERWRKRRENGGL